MDLKPIRELVRKLQAYEDPVGEIQIAVKKERLRISNQLEKALADCQPPQDPKRQGWISVKDRLPDNDPDNDYGWSESVEVYDEPDILIARYKKSKSGGSEWWESNGNDINPTHWKPKPQPPQTQSQEDGNGEARKIRYSGPREITGVTHWTCPKCGSHYGLNVADCPKCDKKEGSDPLADLEKYMLSKTDYDFVYRDCADRLAEIRKGKVLVDREDLELIRNGNGLQKVVGVSRLLDKHLPDTESGGTGEYCEYCDGQGVTGLDFQTNSLDECSHCNGTGRAPKKGGANTGKKE